MPSPLADALDRIGDRWTLLAIAALLEGPLRFNELQAAMGGPAPNILSARLKGLQEQALVVQHPYSERPPRFVYELTALGAELADALKLLSAWGSGQPPRHAHCGTALHATWWCPTCEEPVADPDDGPLDFV